MTIYIADPASKVVLSDKEEAFITDVLNLNPHLLSDERLAWARQQYREAGKRRSAPGKPRAVIDYKGYPTFRKGTTKQKKFAADIRARILGGIQDGAVKKFLVENTDALWWIENRNGTADEMTAKARSLTGDPVGLRYWLLTGR